MILAGIAVEAFAQQGRAIYLVADMRRSWRWLGQRFALYDIAGEYLAEVRRRWLEVVFGESMLAVLFLILWSLDYVPRPMIVVFFVIAGLIAGYHAWRADHSRLIPKLTFGAKRTTKTPTNIANVERLFAQIDVSCSTEAALTDCRGQLLRIMRQSGNDWNPTSFDETLDLTWSIVDQPSVTLEHGVDRRLNIFFVDNSTAGQFTVVSERMPFRMKLPIIPGDVLRFDVRVSANNSPPTYISITASFGHQWDALCLA